MSPAPPARQVLFDGVEVGSKIEPGPLGVNDTATKQMTVGLGVPDGAAHRLQLLLDANSTARPAGEVHPERPELDEANNVVELEVTWCEWGAELSPGAALTIGNKVRAARSKPTRPSDGR